MEWRVAVWKARIVIMCELLRGLAALTWIAAYSVAIFISVYISTTLAMLAFVSLWS